MKIKPLLDTLLGFIPEKYRRFIPLVFVILLVLLFVFPHWFGGLGADLQSYAQTAIAPTP